MSSLIPINTGLPVSLEEIKKNLDYRRQLLDAYIEFAIKSVKTIDGFIAFGKTQKCSFGKEAATAIIHGLGVSTVILREQCKIEELSDDRGKFFMATVVIRGTHPDLGDHTVDGVCSTRHKFHERSGAIVDVKGDKVPRYKNLSDVSLSNVYQHAETQAKKNLVKLFIGHDTFPIEYIEGLFPGQKVKRQEFQSEGDRENRTSSETKIEKHLRDIILEDCGGDMPAALERLAILSHGIMNEKKGEPYQFKKFEDLEKYPGIEVRFIREYRK